MRYAERRMYQRGPASSEGAIGEPSKEVFARLCRECKTISQELKTVLSKLEAHGTTKVGLAAESFLVALKGIMSAKQIGQLKDRLQETRQQMMMAMLVLLWYVSLPTS